MGLRLWIPLLAILAACGGSGLATSSVDGGTDNGRPDAKAPLTADASGSLNALYAVHAGPADLPAFRLCLQPALKPLPNDPSHPMALANYPGVGVGSMAPLGSVVGDHHVILYSALAIADSSSARDADCNTIATDKVLIGEDLGNITIGGGMQMLVVHGPSSARKLTLVTADPAPLDGQSPIHLQVGHFSQKLAAATITAKFGTKGSANTSLGTASFGALVPASVVASGFPIDPVSADFDNYGLEVGGVFWSLADIQRATDPTTTPGALFGGRLNAYALLLVDDIGKSTQHFIAVPLRP